MTPIFVIRGSPITVLPTDHVLSFGSSYFQHLQTIRGAFDHWDQPEITYKRELMDTFAADDRHYDGHVALDWVNTGYLLTQTTPICIILHGLTGGSRAVCIFVLLLPFCLYLTLGNCG